MHVNLEAPEQHAIQSYDNAQVTVRHVKYSNSVIIGRQDIISDWPIQHIQELNETTLGPLLLSHPEIIIIGHNQLGVQIPIEVLQRLSKLRIGIECMSIGAASRTFNVLLGEQRAVVAGIILNGPRDL